MFCLPLMSWHELSPPPYHKVKRQQQSPGVGCLLPGINIIDRDRLWWPSISTTQAMPAHGWTHPRQLGFCSYTLLSEAAEVLVVEDASKDRRCASRSCSVMISIQ